MRVSNSFWGHACPPDTTGLLNKWPLVRGKAKKKKKASKSKRSTVKRVKPKTEKSKTVVKRNTRKKE